MNKKYSPSITQISDISNFTINNQSNNNTLSILSTQSKCNNEHNIKNQKQNFNYQMKSYCISKNNKKDLFLDEDDIKNNENFKIFLNTLLNKKEFKSGFVNNTNNDITLYEDNSNIHSNKKFLLKKLSKKNNKYKNEILNSKSTSTNKERYISNSFRDNQIKNNSKTNNDFVPFQNELKNFLTPVPKIDKKQIRYDKDNKFNKNNDLQNNKEKKNIGVDCRIYEYFDYKNKRNKNKEEITKLAQTFSLKEFDGRMINKLYLTSKNKKNKKSKNNSFHYIKKYIPDNQIPKITFFSRNNDLKEKEIKNKISTMKANAFHFLKDKSQNISCKNCYTYYYKRKKDLNTIINRNRNRNNILLNQMFNPKSKFKLFYGNDRNLMPYIINFPNKKEIKSKLEN